jgi:cobalt-zinc-cadmium efflux system outer membrane protein
MPFKKSFWAGVIACLALPLPAWAVPLMAERESPSSHFNTAQRELALRQFVERVWSENPALQAAQAAVDAARARAEGADLPLHNPALALDAQRTDINTNTIGISQALDWSDKRGALTAIAAAEATAAEAELTAARQRIAVEVLEALAGYLTARDGRDLALHRSQLMKRFSDTAQQRYSAGDVEALEASLAQMAYSEALMQQAASEGKLAQAEAALRAVSGLDAAEWPKLPAELAPPPEKIDAASMLQNLPELALLRARMESANGRIRLAEREGRADPTISVRAGRDDAETLVGLSLEIPLFVRNNFSSGVRAASHDAVQEELNYRDAYRRAQARMEGTLGHFQNSSRAWRAWVVAGQQAHVEQIKLLEKLWQAGELTATGYLVQAKQNIDTQLAAATLTGEVWQAAIAWLEASGQVERWLGLDNTSPADTTNSGAQK